MSETQSNIPFEQMVNDQQHIEMISIALDDYYVGDHRMVIERGFGTYSETLWHTMGAAVHKINHPVVGSYLPTKVIVHDGKMHMLFYVNRDMPGAIRPFEDDGVFYAWAIDWQPEAKFRYPALSRVFVDHVNVNGKIVMLFIADSATYESLLFTPTKEVPLHVPNKTHRWV